MMRYYLRHQKLLLLALLLEMAIIVMLLWPAANSSKLMSQVKPGMTLQEAKRLLGEPCTKGVISGRGSDGGIGGIWYSYTWSLEGELWEPTLSASFTVKQAKDLEKTPVQSCIWVSQSHLLRVEFQNDTIISAKKYAMTRSGGGIPGCIDSIKRYWNKLMN